MRRKPWSRPQRNKPPLARKLGYAPLNRDNYHHGDARGALLQSGLKILSEKTVDELSLREVARITGVSATAVYRHFADKNALLAALSEVGFELLAAAQSRAASKAVAKSEKSVDPNNRATFDAAFNATGYAYVRFALDNPALFRLMFSSAKTIDMEKNRGATDPAFAMLRDYAQKLAGADATASADFATRCWAMVHGLATLLLDKQIVLDDKSIARIMDASAVLGGES